MQEKEDLVVRAGVAGVLEEISVDVGQRVGPGTNLARVSGAARLMARIHVPESASHDLQLDQKARLEIRDKQYAEAADDFQAALGRDPQSFPAAYNLFLARLWDNKLDAARSGRLSCPALLFPMRHSPAVFSAKRFAWIAIARGAQLACRTTRGGSPGIRSPCSTPVGVWLLPRPYSQ